MGVDDDFWDDLLGHIRDQALVPVVGPDVNVVEAGNQTLTTLIGQRLVERYHLTVSPATVTMGQAVAAFLRERGRDDVGELYRRIKDIIEELDLAPGDALRNLAEITDLNLFVNTTPDRLLAKALNEARFQGKPETRELTFSPSQFMSEQSRNAQADEAADTVVLRLFGQAASTPQDAIHKEDRLEWLHAFLSEGAGLPKWLTYRLKHQPMLFVGCEIPDWMGRFLLRMSSSMRLSQEGKQFFIVGSSTAHEPSLSNFLATYCGKAQVQQREMAPTDFVAESLARWERRKRRAARRDGQNDVPGRTDPDAATILISYMREDPAAARRPEQAIAGLGGDVWLDGQRIRPGDAWERETLNAIRQRRSAKGDPLVHPGHLGEHRARRARLRFQRVEGSSPKLQSGLPRKSGQPRRICYGYTPFPRR